MKVYKYLPFTDGSKCILSRGTMKFSHHSEFNDPFDCKTAFNIHKSMSYVESRPDLFKEIARRLSLSPSGLIQNKKRMLHGMKKSLEDGSFQDGVLDGVGICCLTKKPDNILMWSHYAENHKGFVVEFTLEHKTNEMTMDNIEHKLFGWDVEYLEDMPIIVAGSRGFDAVKDVFLIKSPDWQYESEYRVLSMKKGPGVHLIDQSMITKIIAGVNITDDNYQELDYLVNMLSKKNKCNPKLVKAKMSSRQYRLKID